jgi:hypothetical protein
MWRELPFMGMQRPSWVPTVVKSSGRSSLQAQKIALPRASSRAVRCLGAAFPAPRMPKPTCASASHRRTRTIVSGLPSPRSEVGLERFLALKHAYFLSFFCGYIAITWATPTQPNVPKPIHGPSIHNTL